MNNVFWQILRAVLLLFVQIVVLNNIQLFGMVSPFLYTLIIITLPIKMPRNYVMLLGCLIGCVMDVFTNSYGFHFAATVLVAYARPFLMKLFATRENMEKLYPSYTNFGNVFYYYAFAMVFLHHFCLFAIEAFSFYYIGLVLLKTLCSSVFTLILIWGIETLKIRRK